MRGGTGLLGLGAALGVAIVLRRSSGRSAGGPLDRWPIDPQQVRRVGQTAGVQRPKSVHKGVDIFADAGTPVVAPEALRVLRVVDGTKSDDDSQRRAGQWVDGEGQGGRVLRFLHLRPGAVAVREGQRLSPGEIIGEVGEKGTSGVFDSPPHLHFEVRAPGLLSYGTPLDPLGYLPRTGRRLIDRRLRLDEEEAIA
jgi:murein DD-endopeptidase MepM/ murein hydrolase activator NlpD